MTNDENAATRLQDACSIILSEVGEDPMREGLRDTPERFAKTMIELTDGYRQSLDDIVGDALFRDSCSELVLVKKIEFYSLCEHHLLPFFGHAHVAYIPNGTIIGLSKIPRIVRHYSRRLQVQERLTDQIADALESLLQPKGVAVSLEGHHLCMMMRGIEVQSGEMVTSAMRGELRDNAALRAEFFGGVRG